MIKFQDLHRLSIVIPRKTNFSTVLFYIKMHFVFCLSFSWSCLFAWKPFRKLALIWYHALQLNLWYRFIAILQGWVATYSVYKLWIGLLILEYGTELATASSIRSKHKVSNHTQHKHRHYDVIIFCSHLNHRSFNDWKKCTA